MDIFHLLKLTIYWSSDLNISISAGNHVEYSLNFAAFNATHFWYIFSCEAASLPLAQISMPHRMILARDLIACCHLHIRPIQHHIDISELSCKSSPFLPSSKTCTCQHTWSYVLYSLRPKINVITGMSLSNFIEFN
jgi:hypothetical protein